MSRSTKVKVFILLIQLAVIMTFMSAGVATAADAITLAASEPAVIYYTTNGAAPAMPTASYSLVSGQLPVESPEDKLRNKDLKQKLRKKYDLDADALTIRLEHTQHGPKGYINLMRKKSSESTENRTESVSIYRDKETSLARARAKSIALSFIKDEEELFGESISTELIVIREETDEQGITINRFQRAISGIPLVNSIIQIDVDRNGNITWVNGNLNPPPPELYEAVKKEAIPEVRAREIADVVLREVGYDVAVNPYMRDYIKTKKIAISTPPYVLWKVESYWIILIDAFTGEVLEKRSNIRR